MTARAAFKQDDVARAVRGVQAAGLKVARVELEQGRIVVIVDEGHASNRKNPLDRLYAA